MKIKRIRLIDSGAYGEVWEVSDEIDRQLAAKIVRPGNTSGDAIAHAKALSKVNHRNVVAVHAVTEMDDPDNPGNLVPCVVMELVKGMTLAERLARVPVFSLDEVRVIGTAIVAGVAAMHEQGVAHGDLHDKNVMIELPTTVKIIDIGYITGSTLSVESFDNRREIDLVSLRILLRSILSHSEFDREVVAKFIETANSAEDLTALNSTFSKCTGIQAAGDAAQLIAAPIAWLQDQGFVEGAAYAEALLQEMQRDQVEPLLNWMIQESFCKKAHGYFVRLLWTELDPRQQARVATTLSAAIDSTVPQGTWGGVLNVLAAIGLEAWDLLNKRTSMRLEKLIVDDLLKGHVDFYYPQMSGGGELGTWINTFWRHCRDRDQIIRNMAIMLNGNWSTQNYIGKYLLLTLPKLADTAERETTLLKALKRAVANNAFLVKGKIEKLPPAWQQALAT